MPALSSGPDPNDALGFNATGTGGGGGGGGVAAAPPGLGISGFDQELNFDDSILDHVSGGLSNFPFTPSYDLDTFTTTFEDPFNYSRPYEAAPDPVSFHDEESSPQQLDDKLLSFSAPLLKATPLDDATGAYSDVNMTAELHGMFFVAEDVFGDENTGPRPMELTCYRRNLWQCSGQVTLPRHCTQAINEQGRAIPIVEFYASITASESIDNKLTEIISIPWKSSNTALGEGQETKTAGAPPKVALDLSGGQEVDGHCVSFPVSWKRLQFKSATANNGRRKGLQQHYVVQINLLGKMKTGGDLMKIAEIRSGPVIVRGRSPRNFDSRKDVQLSGEKKPAHLEKARTYSEVSTMKQERTDPPPSLHRYSSSGSSFSNDWNNGGSLPYNNGYQAAQQQQHQPQKRMALSPNPNRPPVPAWNSESSINKVSSLSGPPKSASVPSIPINLSLSEDERSPHDRSNSDSLQSPLLNRSSIGGGLASPTEEAEELYEYFPLSVDDWTPLVDTIYRPHIVHHIAVPQEIKAQKVRSKAKRYFSAE
ncbi:hypothetical protein BKA67DRAFT_662431 [Truncatella angustata]|uniref:NDT80 domain-containing protein n=1 Tax=Truncatella angustata TaxID=152316 RepID=A0A9P8UCN0_9PEZI|nr:uncharacterized protein BKA67DRAFT_662431 [Truncatella angustata]KAH6647659.1 hypothetical protein BKA67DRAFT_662431 [Truncatella angustata]KAH8204315.1 hypothetical protein TruAng_001478 [Truncatella angustata]